MTSFDIAAHIAPWTTAMINTLLADNNTLLRMHPGDVHAEFRARVTITRDAALDELHARARVEYQAHLDATPAERHLAAQHAEPEFTAVPKIGTGVYYLGSLAEHHGTYTLAEVCDCDDCERVATAYRYAGGAMHVSDIRVALRGTGGHRLNHVRVGSIRRPLAAA